MCGFDYLAVDRYVNQILKESLVILRLVTYSPELFRLTARSRNLFTGVGHKLLFVYYLAIWARSQMLPKVVDTLGAIRGSRVQVVLRAHVVNSAWFVCSVAVKSVSGCRSMSSCRDKTWRSKRFILPI